MRAATLIAAITLIGISAAAQTLPCSWPLETTGSGITNVAYPDTNATYWTMPISSDRWQSIVIKGTYPQARFFSFTSYVANGSVASDNASLVDVDINPDSGSSNPFVTSGSGPHDYTITVANTAPNNGSNFLPLGSTRLGWIIYRIYVPNKDLDRQAGVPLPVVTLVGKDGLAHTLTECSSRNSTGTVTNLIRNFLHQRSDLNAALLQLLGGGADAGITEPAQCQPTPLVSWIPANTGGYFPNPANKYIAIPGLCLSQDQILVVHGKAPVFPDTYNGGPVWEPTGLNLRYWSACNNNQQLPYPVVACKSDYETNLDGGYYTYVLSESDQSDPMAPPSWLPTGATWLPWGSTTTPNILILRNMLPQPTFGNSVQAAIDPPNNCAVNNQSSGTPRDQIVTGGECAQGVMQHYYPVAVYCSKQVFVNEGWQGCLAAAKSGQ